MLQYQLRWLPILVLILMAPARVPAQEAIAAGGKAEEELREAIRMYDDALRRADVAATERFWAEEYVFIDPRGERVSEEAAIAQLEKHEDQATADESDDLGVWGTSALTDAREPKAKGVLAA